MALLIPSLLSLAAWTSLVGRHRDRRAIVLFPLLSLAYAWFLMTAPSALLWSHIDLLAKVQFPWRLGIVVDLCSMTLIALWLQRATAQKRHSPPALLLVVVALAAPYCVNPGAMYHLLWATKSEAETDYIRRRLAQGDGAPEYRTAWSMISSGALSRHDVNEALAATPQVRIVSGPGTLSGIRQESNRLWADVAATAPVRVRFRRFFYPGWRLRSLPDGATVAVMPSEEFGLLEADLPAGRHHLVLERGATDEERWGTIISAATLALCVLLFAGTRARHIAGRQAAKAGGRGAWT
jgi:hypothetical protein